MPSPLQENIRFQNAFFSRLDLFFAAKLRQRVAPGFIAPCGQAAWWRGIMETFSGYDLCSTGTARVEAVLWFAVMATMGLAPIEPLIKTRKRPEKKTAPAELVPAKP